MEWISVNDRLPDKSGYYLCWDTPYSFQMNQPIIGHYHAFLNDFYTEIADDWSNVTHWMPLPGPPK